MNVKNNFWLARRAGYPYNWKIWIQRARFHGYEADPRGESFILIHVAWTSGIGVYGSALN